MACDTILDILTQESGRFGPEVYNRVFATSPWVGLVNRGRFPSEMGSQISLLTYERSVPTDAVPEWTAISPSDEAEGGSCLPAAKKIAIGSRTRNYALYRRVLEGPDFCVEDLRFKFQLRNQLERILAVLAEYSRNEWEIRYRHDYWFNVSNRTVVDENAYTTSTLTDEGPNFDLPAVCPTSILTQGVLNWSKMKMLRDGAIQSALGRENGGAVLTLVCSAETSDRLIFDNDDIRQDLRWGKPSELLSAYGVERSYRGFYHLIDPYPIRFTCEGQGTYVEVPAFEDAAATKGTKSVINPDWETAPYEASFVFDPQVFHSLIPEPITNPAPNFKFDPVTYLGDWRLKNILDRVCNPDGTIVYHRGILAEGAMPVHPERGWMYIHLRCDPAPNLVTECT